MGPPVKVVTLIVNDLKNGGNIAGAVTRWTKASTVVRFRNHRDRARAQMIRVYVCTRTVWSGHLPAACGIRLRRICPQAGSGPRPPHVPGHGCKSRWFQAMSGPTVFARCECRGRFQEQGCERMSQGMRAGGFAHARFEHGCSNGFLEG